MTTVVIADFFFGETREKSVWAKVDRRRASPRVVEGFGYFGGQFQFVVYTGVDLP